jgi:hypothetical protein
VRYILSIAIYLLVVAGFMVSAASAADGVVSGLLFWALVVVQPLVGLAIGRWWAVALVVLLPLLGLPVPSPQDAYEPIPMWFAMLFFGVPVGALLIAMGVAARKLCAWQWPVLR